MSQPRCSKCGRVLTSPLSISLGIGSTCRGDSGGAKRKITLKVKRSIGYISKTEIEVGKDNKYIFENGYWLSGKSKILDEDFKKWMKRFNVIDEKSLLIAEKSCDGE